MKNPWIQRVLYWTVGLPITLTGLVRRLFLLASGADWADAGFYLATGFVGAGGYSLANRRVNRLWLRALCVCLGWVLCLAGLAWLVSNGWWAFLLIPLLRQGKRLRAAPWEPLRTDWRGRSLFFRLDKLDYVSLAIVCFLGALLWVVHNRLVPFAPDAYYHLLVVRRIVEDGRIPLWDWWEYAPLGWPHLYPPLVHVLIALFSVPFKGDVVEGMRAFQAILLPVACLTTWYFARWMFESRRGFLVLLILGVDASFVLPALFVLPGIVANALLAVALVLFFSGRRIGTGLVLGLMLLTHMGVGPLVLLGLLLFSLWRREYLPVFLAGLGVALIVAMPWYAHVFAYWDWLGHPLRGHGPSVALSVMKLLWLLNVNLVIALLAVRSIGLIRWADRRYQLILCQLIAFLPMLLQYGGRFFMHTAQLWALLAAVPLARFLLPLRRRRVALFVALALCPTLVLGHPGFGRVGMKPMPSGWMFAAIVANRPQLLPEALSYQEAVALGDYIKKTSAPAQVIHIVGNNPGQLGALGVMVALHADRPVDTAAWPEVRHDTDLGKLCEWAETDPAGYYVSLDRQAIPSDAQVSQVGRVYVGIRTPNHDRE